MKATNKTITYSKLPLPEDLQRKHNIPGAYFYYQPISRQQVWEVYDSKGNKTKLLFHMGTSNII